jgi:hypothetical protein
VLVVKEVERADTPPRGRQAGEIFEPDRTAHINDEKPMSQKKIGFEVRRQGFEPRTR